MSLPLTLYFLVVLTNSQMIIYLCMSVLSQALFLAYEYILTIQSLLMNERLKKKKKWCNEAN
jgi:hypothetical protein